MNTVGEHIGNVFNEGELDRQATTRKFRVVRLTDRLRDFLVKGYEVNRQRFKQNAAELEQALALIRKATQLFATPRADGLSSIFSILEQSVFGEPAYPTIESKAAHLLYFVVKNHPFTDGNKRSGAFLFVDFLHRNGRLMNARR